MYKLELTNEQKQMIRTFSRVRTTFSDHFSAVLRVSYWRALASTRGLDLGPVKLYGPRGHEEIV